MKDTQTPPVGKAPEAARSEAIKFVAAVLKDIVLSVAADPDVRQALAPLVAAAMSGSPVDIAPAHVTIAQYSRSRGQSEATTRRQIKLGMTHIPLGKHVRIVPEEADEWRRQRGRKPTTLPKPEKAADDIAVEDLLAASGLRLVANGGRR